MITFWVLNLSGSWPEVGETLNRMDIGEARSQTHGMAIKHLLADIADFVVRPTMPQTQLVFGRAALLVLALVFLLDLSVSFLVSLIQCGVEQAGHEAPEYIEDDYGIGTMILLYVIVAPLTEEWLFRGWLSGRRRSVML